MNQLTVDTNGGANAGVAFSAAQQLQVQQPMQGGNFQALNWNQNGTMFYYQPDYRWPQPNYYGPHRCPNCGHCPCCGR